MNNNEQDHTKHLLRTQNYKNYFIFRRDFVKYGLMDKLEALMISDLINMSGMLKCKKKTFEGTDKTKRQYFLCTKAYLEKSLNWTRKEQIRILANLEILSFIKTVKKGSPPKRWIFIDVEHIEESLDKLLCTESKEVETHSFVRPQKGPMRNTLNQRSPEGHHRRSPEGHHPYEEVDTNVSPNKRRITRRGTAAPAAPPEEDKPSPESFGKKLAAFAHKGISKARKIQRKVSLKSWERSFNDLLVKVKKGYELDASKSKDLIWKVVRYHIDHIKDLYQPKAYSAKSICDRFEDLEEAMNRSDSKLNKKDKSTTTSSSPDGSSSVKKIMVNGEERVLINIKYK